MSSNDHVSSIAQGISPRCRMVSDECVSYAVAHCLYEGFLGRHGFSVGMPAHAHSILITVLKSGSVTQRLKTSAHILHYMYPCYFGFSV